MENDILQGNNDTLEDEEEKLLRGSNVTINNYRTET